MKPMMASDFIAHVHEIARAYEAREHGDGPDEYDACRFYRGFLRDLSRVVDDVNRRAIWNAKQGAEDE